MNSLNNQMPGPKIKICGITNYEDGALCLEHGADYLGFIFYEKSPRYIMPAEAGEIIEKLKAEFKFESVGVFVNPGKKLVNDIIETAAPDILQFHGDESPAFVNGFIRKKIKGFRIKDKTDLDACGKYSGVDYFLFDAFSRAAYGGTGSTFNWALLKDFKPADRLFLAGGITSENVLDAVKIIHPYAVDISSSLEKMPGKKDKIKVERFFLSCKNF